LVAGWLTYGSMNGAGSDHPLAGLLDRGSAEDASAADRGTAPTGEHPGVSDGSRLADSGSKTGPGVDSAEESVSDPGPDVVAGVVAAVPSSTESDEEPTPAPASESDSVPPSDAGAAAAVADSGLAAGSPSPGPEPASEALPRVSLASFAPEAAPETLARLAMPEATALRVLLRDQHTHKDELKEHIQINATQLIIPHLAKLQKSQLTRRQRNWLRQAVTNLENITSPLGGTISTYFEKLTPSELQVADLIKNGKSTKEIADILDLAIRTIESHRKNIRSKLGLRNQKVNLRTYLLSL
jgi:DNA-binding NarL/FixJ family response regulator